MSNAENPFDQTVWDPVNPEQAIEDPFHGPSATFDLLNIPPMPDGNGLYRRFGQFPYRISYENSLGQPVVLVGSGNVLPQTRQQIEAEGEWIMAAEQGDEAIARLEASRQQRRLARIGIANCFKLSDVCPGGKQLKDCASGSAAYEAGQAWAVKQTEQPGDGTLSNVLAWAGGTCSDCSLSCQVSVKTIDGKPEETRVSFYKPNPSMPVIELNIS